MLIIKPQLKSKALAKHIGENMSKGGVKNS
jgi:hypothetical protein